MIHISDSAKKYISNLVLEKKAIGMSVEVVKGGCSGMQFKFSMEYNKNSLENEVKINDFISFFIKNSAFLFVFNSQLDYVKTGTGGKLMFVNLNTKGLCSCGKSFR